MCGGRLNDRFADITGREMGILKACVLLLRALLVPKSRLAIENLALRQQVAVFKQSVKRPNCFCWATTWPRQPYRRHGNRRSPDCTTITLAEFLLRTSHRLDTSGVPRPHDRTERRPFAPHPHELLRLLPQLKSAFIAGSQLANTTCGGGTIER